MKWLDYNFQTIEALVNDVEKEQFTRAFILRCYSKSYLLSALKCSRQRHHRRLRRGPINPRSRDRDVMGSTSVPSRLEDPIFVQPPN
ncbi:hypothetical protein J1N35_042061 [Gossypium stocksii]|uniref:Uncharacterized protein n=1 Tax=Gossypium stocksii TaxID=47602 RepID=A0A9D3ZJZ5_9ROSI|nr:hypothetical protein J1N35_042061 [Gossypium stocksii]